MTPYLVRVIDKHMIVGFFCAGDMADLHYWVDSVADPGICEYRELDSGGVVWKGSSPTIWAPQALNGTCIEIDGLEIAMQTARLSESWSMTFYEHDAKWQPMAPMQYGPTALQDTANFDTDA